MSEKQGSLWRTLCADSDRSGSGRCVGVAYSACGVGWSHMMEWWGWVLLASMLALATKLTGFLVPARWLEGAVMLRVASAMTIGLLAALVTLNTFTDGPRLVLDARLGALATAAVALMLRAPFLLVVIIGAAAAAALRWFSGS